MFHSTIINFSVSLHHNTKTKIMSGGNPADWGKKGYAIGVVIVVFILFVSLLIWVYGMNQNGLG